MASATAMKAAVELSILNADPKRIPGPTLLHQLVATHDSPETLAIDYISADGISEQVTYSELHQRSNRLAKRIRHVWERTQDESSAGFVVPLFMAQCPDLYVAQIAVLKAGGAFCPISLDVPEERLRFILGDVNAKLLLTTAHLRQNLPKLEDVTLIATDEEYGDVERSVPEFAPDPAAPAYIMYTSGSTGQPKGVILSHSAATQALLAHDCHIPRFSRFLQFASPTFDVSVFEIFFPFFRAATLVCGDRRQLLSDLPGFVNRMDIDAAELTPSVASSLLQGRSSVPTLKTLLTIGEMLKQDVLEDFGGSVGEDSMLHGMYGPTEATIHCTLQPSFQKDMPVGNIGIPLGTVSAFIVRPLATDSDPAAQPEIVPIGEEGELAVGGHQLADGYLNRPGQTKAAFVWHNDYGVLYRTGDRAKMTSSGKLECLGRISSGQVKLRGQRIELGEIEYAASKTPGCQSAVAEVVSSTLVIFIIGNSAQASRAKVLETCRKWLPAFMVPGDVVFLGELPYLASGKVDRKALHALYSQRAPDDDDPSEQQMSSSLKVIVETLQSGLNTSTHPSTPLMTIGLDSLSAIRIASQLRKNGFPNLDATVLLDAQTPMDIEHAIANGAGHSSIVADNGADDTQIWAGLFDTVLKDERLDLLTADIERIFPATPLQSAMLLETARNSRAYCNWVELAITGTFSSERIKDSIADLARHHALLRSGFVAVSDSEYTHSVITWKSLLPSQIKETERFDYSFAIGKEEDLLRPCSFQLLNSDSQVRVLMVLHHALYDQWSMDVLKADLGALLDSKTVDHPPSFDRVSIFHHHANHDTRTAASIDFWQDQLRDFSPTLLPLMNSKRHSADLERTSWQALGHGLGQTRTAAQGLGCSVPAVYQAALAYLLGSYVGNCDVTYGTVFSGRHVPIPDIERVFGPCLSTLPVRIDYGATRTVRDLVRLVHDRNRLIQRHSLLPMSHIKSAANVNPETTLFDVLFVWQDASLSADHDENIVREVDSADQHEFNLVIEFEPSGDELKARTTYRRNLITAKQVDVMLRQISELANALLQDHQKLVEDLSQSVSGAFLSISNPSPSPCATSRDFIRTIEKHAVTHSKAPALMFAHQFDEAETCMRTLSYGELNERANQMAHYLSSLGHSQCELVCICMDKSVELYVAILATLKAGHGYLPLLPDTPSARVASIVRQAGVTLCIYDNNSSQSMHGIQGLSTINVSNADFDTSSTGNLPTPISGSDVAYSVFTSGSTGEPKGVAVTAENLLGNLETLSELYQVNAGDRLLQACSQAFDVSVFEIFFSFYTGICLCSATKDILFADLEAGIRTFGITHLSLTPTVAALIDPENVPTVKFLVTAGEAVSELVHDRWAGKGLHQGYGPSETTNICTINMNVQHDDVLGNIGPPFRNTSAMVVAPGPGLNILPAGAVGEFAFGGEQVFKGYIGMDELNAERIIQHPRFGRVYKSGDVGRVLHDGTLLVSGRLDDQVKLRGNRIELGEINAALLRSATVHDCTALVVGDGAAEQDLISFAVLHSSPASNSHELGVVMPDSNLVEQLFSELEDSLPSYMIPSMIITVNRLPLTSQGKLDRRALKLLIASLDNQTRTKLSRSSEPLEDSLPWSEIERKIANTLAIELSITPSSVSRNAAFFGLGLNSLSAISLAKHLTGAVGTPVTPGMVLRNPSVSRLARFLEREGHQKVDRQASDSQQLLPEDLVSEVKQHLARQSVEFEQLLPCTPLQEAMVSAGINFLGSYCNTTWLSVTADVGRLKRCWQEMVERHSILRTRLLPTDSPSFPVVQAVMAYSKLPWFESQHDEHHKFSAQQKVHADAPFRIEVFPSTHGAKLALHMHHAIYDGISMARLLQEVECTYRGESLPPAVSFAAFLKKARDQQSEGAIKFWSAKLGGLQPSPFPQPADKQNLEEGIVRTTLAVQGAGLDSFCKRYGVTPLSVFQASLAKVLAHAQNITDICFGNVVSGRSVPIEDVEKLVAPCFNTIPVRTKLDRTRSNLDLIRAIAADNVESIDYQLAPLRRLQTLSAEPSKRLFDALLLLQPADTALDQGIWSFERDVGSMGLPLVVETSPDGDDFTLAIHHLDAVIPRPLARSLTQAFIAAVHSCLDYPLSDPSQFAEAVNSGIKGALAPSEEEQLINGHVSRHDAERHEWSTLEIVIRDLFARFTTVDPSQISRDTSMYQLGLDSLNAPQIASQLRSKGYSVDAADVMEALTPASIARVMQSTSSADQNRGIDLQAFDRKHRPTILQGTRIPVDDILKIRPCTSVQNGMIAQSLQSHGDLYINHVTYKLPTRYSQEQIRCAWLHVLRKHEMLRAVFYNLQDPQTPFAMIVRGAQTVEAPLLVAAPLSSMDVVQQQAKDSIMADSMKSRWQITLSFDQRTEMTISMHHALYDAESLQIILSDLQHSLDSRALGQSLDLDSILSSTISSERESLESTAAESFWTEQFENATSVRFPDLSPTVTSQSHLEAEVLGCGLSLSNIEEFCRKSNATIQALGQTIWAMILSAYTGEDAVTFGTVFSGRDNSPTWQTAFPSVVTIPVPCNVEQAPLGVLQTMVQYNAGAQRHRFTPLADIQRFARQPGRSMFDTVFVHQKTASASPSVDWPIIRETAAVDYAASLELEVEGKTGVQVRLTFDTARIPPAHAKIMTQQYDMLLEDFVSGRMTDYRSAPALFSAIAAPTPAIPSDVQLLHEFVERGAVSHPDRVAFEFVSGFKGSSPTISSWMYSELDEISNQIAHAILDTGAQPGTVIAVCMEKCPEATFAFVGILKAGCAFLALDPELPQDRVTFILEDSGANGLLVSGTDSLAAIPDGVPSVNLDLKALMKFPSTRPKLVHNISPNDTCYVLYTSGTTGAPKGCEITHENAVQAMLSFQRLFTGHWTAKSRWLQFASYWFDVSVLEQFWSWSVGISVVGAPRDLVLEDLPAFIQALGITHIDLTPSLARLVHPDDVPSLWGGVFITGGEALKQEIIDAWGSKHTICNGYGPTEATIGVTMNTFVGTDAKPSNIGRAFNNVGGFVLHPKTGKPVIRGAVGELCVSGKLVGKGYLNRPELTAKQFPYVTELGERIYRTGDLVRLLADDSYQFIGRQDTQAKLRGQRLEIAEIDTVIRQSTEAIADVVSLVVKNDHGKETLISFLSLTESAGSKDGSLDVSDAARETAKKARSACEQRLPAYMVPTHIIPLNSLPLTVNNKVDSKRLSKTYESLDTKSLQDLQRQTDDSGPLTNTERDICIALTEMFPLHIDQIKSSSNLFSLGLSSISAISYVSVLKRAGFDNANVAAIMKNQTIAQLAAALMDTDSTTQCDKDDVEQAKLTIKAHAQRYRGIAARSLRLPLEGIEAVTPCTPLQQGLILESMRDDSRPYFNHFTYRVHDVDISRLEQACNMLVSHVHVLRTSFVGLADGYTQVIRKESPSLIRRWPASSGDVGDVLAKKKQEWIQSNAEELSTPVEIHLVECSAASLFVVHIHHALYDGVSYELMVDLLWQIYSSGSAQTEGPSFLEALPYGPLKHSAGTGNFWRQRLQGFDFVALPKSSSKTLSDPMQQRLLRNSTAIEQKRQALGVSHQAMTQAAFEIALRQCHATRESKTYGVVVSGRSIELEGADRILGPMFNTLPHPVTADPTASSSEHVRHLHNLNAESMPYQHTPLRDIRKFSGIPAGQLMFDMLFVFQHTRKAIADQPSGRHCTLVGNEPRAEYPLACEVELLNDGQLNVTLLAQGQYLTDKDLEELLSHLQHAFEALITSAESSLGDLFGVERVSGTGSGQAKERKMQLVNGVDYFEWSKEAKRIRELVCQLVDLSIEAIDEHTSIFSLGLDSIDAVKLASRMKSAGLTLPVSEILRAQTIPRMLQCLQTTGYTAGQMQISRLESLEQDLDRALPTSLKRSISIERILPATPSQEALLADMLRSDFREYFNHDILRLGHDVDIDRLTDAWQTVADGSPILRTSFTQVTDPDVEAVFAQIIHRPHTLDISNLHFESLKDVDKYLESVRQDVSMILEERPPLRLAFASIGAERYLVLSLAHALYDGHSLALMHEDVQRAYGNSYKDRPSYDEAIESALTAVGDDAKQFWRTTLSEAKPLAFPAARNSAGVSTVHRFEVESCISSDTARSFCQQHMISMQALAQTCWALTLAQYTRSLEVLFGVVLACRDSEEAEQIMFPMMNTVVVRSALHGTRFDMLQYMQSAITETLSYQRTPLRVIQKATLGAIETGDLGLEGALFDTLIIYQHRPEARQSDTMRLYESVDSSSSVEYPVAVEMEVVGGTVSIRAACKGTVLDEQGTRGLVNRVEQVLMNIVAGPHDATVDLSDGKASICGLKSFVLRSPTSQKESRQERAGMNKSLDWASSPVVNAVLEVFAQVSDVSPGDLGPSSTIESIGIDSISAIKVASLLRRKDINVSVSDIVKAKSAMHIAAVVSGQGSRPIERSPNSTTAIQDFMGTVDVEAIARRAGVDPTNVDVVMPATAGQTYMLNLWTKTRGQIFYPTFTYRFKTELSGERVNSAWSALVERHAILRTVFVGQDKRESPILQVVLRRNGMASSSAEQPFVSLDIHPKTVGYELGLRIHHALYDAVSLPLLMQDLECLLEERQLTSSNLKLEDLIAPSMTSEVKSRQRDFWTSYLRKVAPIKLCQPAIDGQQSKVEMFKPGPFKQAAQLDAVARKQSLSIQALLFAAFAKVYATFPAKTGRVATDVVLGTYLSNRSHLPELEALAAPTLNLVPLLVRSPKTRDLLELAKEVQKDLEAIGTLENSTTALWEIAEWTGIKVDKFVNFLKLPERSEREDSEGIVSIEEVSDRRVRERSEVVAAESCANFEAPAGLENLSVMEAYQHSVDVEMSVTDGRLDVGLFAPTDMISLEEGDEALARLRNELSTAIGDMEE